MHRGAARRASNRLILYGLVLLVSVWLVGPFVWLFVTSVSYQRNLLARPLSFVPPEVTLENYRMVLGFVRFHAEGQAAKILPSMLNSLIVAVFVTGLNLVSSGTIVSGGDNRLVANTFNGGFSSTVPKL